jgi:hypothetical protein
MLETYKDTLVNLRGHNLTPEDYVLFSSLDHYWQHSLEMSLYMFDALRNSEQTPDVLRSLSTMRYLNRCEICNEAMYLEEVEPGKKVTVTKSCPAPQGYPPFDITLDCPSGQMIFANDFRELVEGDESFDVNAILGTIKTIQGYEEKKMLHFLVGNSCPGVMQRGDSEICVSREYDEETDSRKTPEGFEEKYSVCTDLWWVSAMDYEYFKSQCKAKGIEESQFFPSWDLRFLSP